MREHRALGGGVRHATVATTYKHCFASCCGLFGLTVFVPVYDGPLNAFSSWPVRGALQHPNFGIIRLGETAQNRDIKVLGVDGSLHSPQLLYYSVNAQHKLVMFMV